VLRGSFTGVRRDGIVPGRIRRKDGFPGQKSYHQENATVEVQPGNKWVGSFHEWKAETVLIQCRGIHAVKLDFRPRAVIIYLGKEFSIFQRTGLDGSQKWFPSFS
jgi:hypothetical protein